MQYRFYLDGNLLQTEPEGWPDFVTAMKADDEFRAIFLAQTATLTFWGDGKDYLKTKFDADDVCALVELVVEYACNGNAFEEMLRGNIFITSLNFQGAGVKTKIHDDSFFAKIYNNKSIRAYLDTARSKTGETITATPQKLTLTFDPCPSAACAGFKDIPSYKIFDCFRYIIDFMTDGEVDFSSDAFDVGGEWEGHTITTGLFLRDPGNLEKRAIPFISFQEIFIEVNKKYNIGMDIEHVGNTPVLRIEPFDYFSDTAVSVILPSPSDVKIYTDISKLYAKVEIGSSETLEFDDCTTGNKATFPENADYATFKQEEFPLLTKCNDDKTLNLVSSWIISSNVIQNTVIGGDDSHDEQIFFIEAIRDDATHHTAVQTDIFNDGNCYYNAFYMNQNVLSRWNDALPSQVQVIIGSINNTFEAWRDNTSAEIQLSVPSPTYTSLTTDGFGNALEIFEDDYIIGADGGVQTGGPNNYGATVNPVVQVPQGSAVGATESLYIVPTNGSYSFRAFLSLIDVRRNVTFPVFSDMDVTININHYDSGGNLVLTYSDTATFTVNWFTPQTLSHFLDTGVFAATAGDYVSVTYNITGSMAGAAIIFFKINGGQGNDTGFTCYFSQGFGGTLTQDLNNDYPNILMEFEYPLTWQQFQAIKANTKKKIAFDWCAKDYHAAIHDIQFNHHDNSKLILKISKNGYRNNP